VTNITGDAVRYSYALRGRAKGRGALAAESSTCLRDQPGVVIRGDISPKKPSLFSLATIAAKAPS
jgi:hypothetical protein